MNTKQCLSCGTSDRYKSGKCKKCVSIKSKIYASVNKDRIKLMHKEYYQSNKERIIKRTKEWAENNKERVKQRSKEYHIKNRDILNKKSSEYRMKNKSKIKTVIQLWCERNRDRLNKKKNEWVSRNKGKVKEIKNKNRVSRLSAEGKLSPGIYDKLMMLQDSKCVYCKRDLLKNKIHIDHIMPLKLGGNNTDNNVQLLCQQCNNRKHAKHPVDFAKEMGFLL
jgi:5-methylcytosine-specific restriction endonuclease McrA